MLFFCLSDPVYYDLICRFSLLRFCSSWGCVQNSFFCFHVLPGCWQCIYHVTWSFVFLTLDYFIPLASIPFRTVRRHPLFPSIIPHMTVQRNYGICTSLTLSTRMYTVKSLTCQVTSQYPTFTTDLFIIQRLTAITHPNAEWRKCDAWSSTGLLRGIISCSGPASTCKSGTETFSTPLQW